MAQKNVWVHALDGRTIRVERVSELYSAKVSRQGWVVFGELGRGKEAPLADPGRGPRARRAAERLRNEWPQAVDAAKGGETIHFIKRGYPKGEGQWSTLASPPAGIRQIPPPGDGRQQGRDRGTG